MHYEKELGFLIDVLKRCTVGVRIIPREELTAAINSDTSSILPKLGEQKLIASLGTLREKTMYRVEDALARRFICLPLADDSGAVLLIGPFIKARMDEVTVLEIAERLGISPKELRYLQEYLLSLPIVDEAGALGRMINAFAELMWQTSSFSIVDTAGADALTPSPLSGDMHEGDIDGITISAQAMEKRYEYENMLIRAVELGQLHKETQLLGAVTEIPLEKRTTDPLRNAKNYAIILNTLLRKAAERGGVHPVYIDRVSGEIAVMIEGMTDASHNSSLMPEIFRRYCRLVRKHSTAKYTPAVRRAIIVIDSDLSANLTLSTLAKAQSISPGYLSAVFKREVGVTVSEFIRERRMKHAEHLLSTTSLQVQTVALYCGILDVQYFSRLFKRHTGKTPREYRESAMQKS